VAPHAEQPSSPRTVIDATLVETDREQPDADAVGGKPRLRCAHAQLRSGHAVEVSRQAARAL
jgi:hypothetical protein